MRVAALAWLFVVLAAGNSARASTVTVVGSGDADLQATVVQHVEGWLRGHGHTLGPPLSPEATSSLLNCMVMDDQGCARGVVEAQAKASRLGVWQGEARPPWEWRAERWQSAESQSSGTAPEGCVIKGNISRGDKVYHMPWSPWYGKTRIDTSRGERWFCTEADAAKAGFRQVAGH